MTKLWGSDADGRVGTQVQVLKVRARIFEHYLHQDQEALVANYRQKVHGRLNAVQINAITPLNASAPTPDPAETMGVLLAVTRALHREIVCELIAKGQDADTAARNTERMWQQAIAGSLSHAPCLPGRLAPRAPTDDRPIKALDIDWLVTILCRRTTRCDRLKDTSIQTSWALRSASMAMEWADHTHADIQQARFRDLYSRRLTLQQNDDQWTAPWDLGDHWLLS